MNDNSRLRRQLLAYNRTRSGKHAARLFDALSAELLTVARRVAPNEGEAEDLVQATFLAVLESPESYDPDREVRPWVMGILTKEARYWRRSASRQPDPRELGWQASTSGPRAPSAADASVDASNVETHDLVAVAVSRLPEPYREVLSQHLQEEQSPREIAKRVQRSPATVRVQLHRGLAQLRELLPVGLATGMGFLLAPRGLAAVRDELLEHVRWRAQSLGSSSLLSTAAVGPAAIVSLACLALLMILLGDWGPQAEIQLSSEGLQKRSTQAVHAESPGLVPVPSRTEKQRLAVADEQAPDSSSPPEPEICRPLTIDVVWSDGTPAQGITLDMQRTSGGISEFGWRRTTDANGRVHFESLPEGNYAVTNDRGGSSTSAPGLVTITWAEGTDEATKQAARLQINQIEVLIERGTDISGRVVDQHSSPIVGAEIWISSGLSRANPARATSTDSSGRFLLRSASPGNAFGVRHPDYAPSLSYWARGFVPSSDPAKQVSGSSARTTNLGRGIRPGGGHPRDTLAGKVPDDSLSPESPVIRELEIRMTGPGASVAGVVRDPLGQPVSGARVRIGAQDRIDFPGQDGAPGIAPPQEALSNELGEFRLEGLTPGVNQVAAVADDYPVWTGDVEAQIGIPGDLTVEFGQPIWLGGTVCDPQGNPLQNVTLTPVWPRTPSGGAYASSFRSSRMQTASDGRFELGPLGIRDVEISVSHFQRLMSRARGEEGATPISDSFVFTQTMDDREFSVRFYGSGANDLWIRDFRCTTQPTRARAE